MSKHFRPGVLSLLLLLLASLLAACGTTQPAVEPPSSNTVKGPRIAVSEDSFDFGKVALDKTVSHSFEIRNVGSEALLLSGKPEVRAAQGC